MFAPLANTVLLLDESSNTSSIDDFSSPLPPVRTFSSPKQKSSSMEAIETFSIDRHGKLGKQQVLINGNKVSAEIRK
jgi:hypothetical protein